MSDLSNVKARRDSASARRMASIMPVPLWRIARMGQGYVVA